MEPTITDHLIAFLFSARSTRIYRKILWSRMYARKKGLTKAAFHQKIYRLRKKGIIETKDDYIFVRRKNLLAFLAKRNSFIKDFCPDKTQKVLVSFDIPEIKRKTRDWLRNQMKYWDFQMIHKSLWLGYGPLPKEFYDRLKYLNIRSDIRIFRIKKST